MYQKPTKLFFQEPWELEGLANTGNLVQKFLPKQADIGKILKTIQRRVLKGTHSFDKRDTDRILNQPIL